MAKVVVAMSGGVDSSVAAALLKNDGHEVIGVTMRVWGGEPFVTDQGRHACYGPSEEEDMKDVERVADNLGIPFLVIDLRGEYKAEVLDYFRSEYSSGRTPNPCVRCNQRVKFGLLAKKLIDHRIQFDYFATGHYARIGYDRVRGRYLLKKARDLTKDQSYFLFALSQEQLSRTLFPIGNLTKKEVRKIASDLGLEVSDKPESQDFVAGGYTNLVKDAANPGPILDTTGNRLGTHRGIPFYTVGQRKGLGLSTGRPMYVVAIDRARNAVIVGTRDEASARELVASELNWIAIDGLREPIEAMAKIRYQHKEVSATVEPLNEDEVYVSLAEAQMGIAPGQAVVFYDGDVVVGGGIIRKGIP